MYIERERERERFISRPHPQLFFERSPLGALRRPPAQRESARPSIPSDGNSGGVRTSGYVGWA